MNGRRALGWALALTLSGVSAGTSGRVLERLNAERGTTEELLYLPSGRYLQALSLGQAPLLADLVYLWAIQYYSSYDRRDRYRYVEHVFGDVIPRLDPHYIDAYWLGALILSAEAGDLRGAIRLLDQGFAENPDQWILPYLAGWECYRSHELVRAAAYFEKAEGVPGAPAAVARMRAGMITRAGDLRLALRLWQDVLADSHGDEATRAIAQRQVRALEVKIDLDELERAIGAFRSENGRNPARLSDLRARGYIRDVPRDPQGREYRYDPRTGAVATASGRVLGGA